MLYELSVCWEREYTLPTGTYLSKFELAGDRGRPRMLRLVALCRSVECCTVNP